MSKSKSKSKRKPPAKKRSPAARSGEKESTPVQQAPQRSGPNWNFIAVVVALIAIPVAGFLLYRNWYIASLPQGEIDGGLPNQRVNADQPFSGLKHGKGTAWETTVSQSETWNKIDNASGDGWDTEVFANKVTSQLNKLKKIIAKIDSAEASAVDEIVASDVAIASLQPETLKTTFRDDVLHVQQAVLEPKGSNDAQVSGTAGGTLIDALRQMVQPYRDPKELRIKFKVFRVDKAEESVATHQLVEIFGPTENGLLEQNAIWKTHWEQNDSKSGPRLTKLSVVEYERVERFGAALFSDCTESVLTKNSSFHDQLLQGYNVWLARSQFRRFFSILGNPGIAIGDVNGDGLEDLYLCQESGLPNLLFVQNEDGTLTDQSADSGADWLQSSRSALIVDLNNDGFQDLTVAVKGGVVVASGNGTGKFEIRQILDTSDDVIVLAAADYDQDGRIDIYAGAYYQDPVLGSPDEDIAIGGAGGQFIFYDANDGGQNSLLRNEIDGDNWLFSDVAEKTGLNVNGYRWTLAAAWEDFDNDGDQDLYVANDYGLNNLYRNDLQSDGSRTFVDVSNQAGTEDSASGMSVTWGDYDRSGWMDLYVSNMYSTAGNRITFQNQFKSEASDEIKRRFQRFARGNTLLKNLGDSDHNTSKAATTIEESDTGSDVIKFLDRSIEAGVNRGRWAWASRFVDINNDGWEDLVVANGYITTDDDGDL